ncbi:MAG: ribbon-helix-helix protein, CopG family [Oligoflexia bacterium]|nr:ribbon-helix-helix protein, CopG family [Oligoflexia bacterium]
MRTTKIMTFSVPPSMEELILKQAKVEHRTVSEFLREAVRKYMLQNHLDTIATKGKVASKKLKLKAEDVDSWVKEDRKSTIKKAK